MWQKVGILVGGYGFIMFSYTWVMVITAGLSRCVSAERLRVGKADVKAVGGIMAVWTAAWAIMMLMDC